MDRAAQRWPGEPRSKLILRLIKAGDEGLRADSAHHAHAHRAAVTASSGKYADAFPTGYLTDLRADWTE